MDDQARAALGSFALLTEQSVKQNSPKLSPQQLRNLTDAEAVALTYVFDLATRWTLLFGILESFAPLGDPVVARAMRLHYDAVSGGATWQDRAAEAHQHLLDATERVGDRAINARNAVADA